MSVKQRSYLWKRTFKTKEVVRASIFDNDSSMMLRNSILEKNHYVIIFDTTQLVDEKKRIRAIHDVIVTSINDVLAKESITFTYIYDNEIFENDYDAYKSFIKRKLFAKE